MQRKNILCRRWIICFTLSLLILIMAFQVSASAYATTPAHSNFASGTITYQYNRLGASNRDWSGMFSSAIAGWNNYGLSATNYPNATKPKIVSTSGSPQVHVMSQGYADADWTGQHGDNSSAYVTRHYSSTTIRLNDTYWTGFSSEGINTILHEFGHRFGLADVNNQNAAMHGFRTNIIYAHADDREGLARIWYRCRQLGE